MAKSWTLSGHIATVERHVVALAKAGWVFFRSLRGRSPALERHITHTDNQETVEESKYYPPPGPHDLEPEGGELPESYDRTRLVGIVVDLYTVHAYWEVRPEDLAAARASIRDAPARPVLRFSELSEMAPADVSQPPQWFDVEIDLQAGNCNVELWSAGKTYRIDLGFVSGEHELVTLATSNTIRTPRAWPVVASEQQFLRVDADRKVIEFVPPPAVKPPRAQPPPLTVEEPAAVKQPVTEEPLSSVANAAGASVAPIGAQDTHLTQSTPPAPTSGASNEILMRRLTELLVLRAGSPEPPRPPGCGLSALPPAPASPIPATLPAISPPPVASSDLAEMAEGDFVPGVSSPTARNPRRDT